MQRAWQWWRGDMDRNRFLNAMAQLAVYVGLVVLGAAIVLGMAYWDAHGVAL